MVRVNTERVERAMRERGLSIVRLARRAHMTYHGCWSVVRGRTAGIRFDKLDSLCRALRLKPGDILTRERGVAVDGEGDDEIQAG